MNTVAINQTDGYKVDHRSQYPEGTELVYSNFTPRSTAHSAKVDGVDNKIVVFGQQYFVKWFLIETFNKEFFNKPKDEVVAKYKRRIEGYLGPDAITYEHIEALHDLGYLPISIRALPEGSVVDERIATIVLENTLPEFFWVTNFLESVMSCMMWLPSTSATTARKYRILLEKYANETGGDLTFVPLQGHDFSFRGMAGIQASQMSGAGHLLSFVGTDTIPAIDFLEDYYNADCEKELIGCSVPATEHSVMCMGSKDGEIETFRRLITEIYPKGIVSIVSDTWDFWQVITEFLPKLKETILARSGGYPIDRVVIRPDSGDPVKIICGDPNAIKDSPEYKGAIECMWETFGGAVNEKGYKVLDSHIGLIYGDSITLERCEDICSQLKKKGFASTNVVLGIGSFTYQYVTRDTLGYAMKATAGVVNGEYREIFKDPKTDSGMKKSAKGYLAVFKDTNGEYIMVDQVERSVYENCDFVEIFRDGKLLVDYSLTEIRERLQESY
jgi:nicotinamide phosphoribosyltransferase